MFTPKSRYMGTVPFGVVSMILMAWSTDFTVSGAPSSSTVLSLAETL